MKPTREQLQTTLDTLMALQEGIDKSVGCSCSDCERFNLLEAAGHIVQDYIEAAEPLWPFPEPMTPSADWSVGKAKAKMASPTPSPEREISTPGRFDYDKAKAELAAVKAKYGEIKPPKPEPAETDEDGRKLDDAIGQAY